MEFVEVLRNSLLIPGRKNLVHAHKRDIRYMLFVTNLVARWRASATDTNVSPHFIMSRWPREASNAVRSGLITLHRPDCDPPHILPIVVLTGRITNILTCRRFHADGRWANGQCWRRCRQTWTANPVHNLLSTCGITNAAHHAIFIDIEGLDSIAAFASMSGDADVTEMAKRMASRPTIATGRVILGTMQIKRLQALVYSVKDGNKRGMQASPELWALQEMNTAMEQKESKQNYGKIDVDIIDPGKIAFVNKLNATMGAA
jgi:hypothetical protein